MNAAFGFYLVGVWCGLMLGLIGGLAIADYAKARADAEAGP